MSLKPTDPMARPSLYVLKTGYSASAIPPAASSPDELEERSKDELVLVRRDLGEVNRSAQDWGTNATPTSCATVAMRNTTPATMAILRFAFICFPPPLRQAHLPCASHCHRPAWLRTTTAVSEDRNGA